MDGWMGTRRWSKVKLVWRLGERRLLPPSLLGMRGHARGITRGIVKGSRGTRPAACQEIAISLRLLDGDKCRPSPRGWKLGLVPTFVPIQPRNRPWTSIGTINICEINSRSND